MHIPPKRRRRAIHVHYLTQRGRSQREIAEQLKISKATVRSDLQLIETHWSQIAAPAADDLLLESLRLLQIRLSLAIKHDDVTNNADRLTPVEYLRARENQETRLNALAREIRRTVQQIHLRAEQRPDQPGLYGEEPQELSETSPKSGQTDRPDSMISSPEQEIVADQAPEEKTPAEPVQLPEPPDQDALIAEVLEHFPHLKGQPEEEILQFLDHLTDPNT
ncbi:MAG: DeoR family transcriptional regulator, partial [Chloroflexi bacterium]|nr:DeoR family transcriptional regulator [Chloroflexota bacterium]